VNSDLLSWFLAVGRKCQQPILGQLPNRPPIVWGAGIFTPPVCRRSRRNAREQLISPEIAVSSDSTKAAGYPANIAASGASS
jgi:hypothetical protein